jgi:uncharacterized protein YjeT (DUF2065 family)
MAVLMPIGYYGAIRPLVTEGNAAATVSAIEESPLRYFGGVTAIVIVILLDILVAAAWFSLFAPVNRRWAAAAAWIRILYTALFALAAAQLIRAFVSLAEPQLALEAIDAFSTVWLSSLGIFGIHLLVIGCLAVCARFIPSILGVLLIVAAGSYGIDAVGVVFSRGLPFTVASVGFIGEVVMIVWLFVSARALRSRVVS